MLRTLMSSTLLLFMSIALANAVELKDLMPCKPAAARLCDRSEGISLAALWKCGATLALRRHEIGQPCVEVLRRFGQL
jgi:hypothetical protein